MGASDYLPTLTRDAPWAATCPVGTQNTPVPTTQLKPSLASNNASYPQTATNKTVTTSIGKGLLQKMHVKPALDTARFSARALF